MSENDSKLLNVSGAKILYNDLRTRINEKIDASLKGSANGLAELDQNGKVPASQLPSYVDDVLEFENLAAFPASGQIGKIYVAKNTNLTYRWGGSEYVEISSSLALGETNESAYRGDRGKIAYDHAAAKGTAFENGLYKITTNEQGHVTGATAVIKSDITNLGIPGEVPTKVSELQNDSGYLTTHQDITGKQDVLTFDTAPQANSTNPVTSNGIKVALDLKANSNDIPTKVSELQNDSGYLTQHQDLSGKQDILTFDSAPTVNSTNPVTSNGIKIALDTKANSAAVPTKVSDLQNDAGYLTTHQDISGKADKTEIPTKVSQLDNDSGYLTTHQDISGKQDTLTFDSSPRTNSTNPVTSNGIYQAVNAKLDAPNSIGGQGQVLTTDGSGGQAWTTFSSDGLVTVSIESGENPSENILKIEGLTDIQSVTEELEGKQDILTFDTTPRVNSINPVTSNGIKVALDLKADSSDIPTKVSELQNDSGYLTTHQDISGKQDTLTFDAIPIAGSNNPVKSGGIKTALDAKLSVPSTGNAGEVLIADGNGGQGWGAFATNSLVSVSVASDNNTPSKNTLNINGLNNVQDLDSRLDGLQNTVSEINDTVGNIQTLLSQI